MAPRHDNDPNYKKKPDCCEVNVQDVLPNILHKKHKVVKLVRSQVLRAQQDRFLCEKNRAIDDPCENDIQPEDVEGNFQGGSKPPRRMRRSQETTSETRTRTSTKRGIYFVLYLLALILAIFLLIFLIVWISSGPLSNFIAHTPIPTGAFVRTEGLCSLEKKYLLRWSKPEYFE